MSNNLLCNNNKPTIPNETLKATSLLYLREALLKQKYEDCTELIQTAKEFGAQQNEISGIIAEAVRGEQGGQQNEANKQRKGRRRV
jgi:4-aminobutyrate aminotransferase-like enzyme